MINSFSITPNLSLNYVHLYLLFSLFPFLFFCDSLGEFCQYFEVRWVSWTNKFAKAVVFVIAKRET
jgi:hypothetical protein